MRNLEMTSKLRLIVGSIVYLVLLFNDTNADIESKNHTDCSFPVYANTSVTISVNSSITNNSKICTWHINSNENTTLVIFFTEFNIAVQDLIIISDSKAIWTFPYNSDVSGRHIPFSSNNIILTFHKKSNEEIATLFELFVAAQHGGGYFTEAGNATYISNFTDDSVNETWYLFEMEEDMQVIIKLRILESFPSNGITFYDGETTSNVLNHFQNENEIYAVFSTKNVLLMLINDTSGCTLEIEFQEIENGINVLSQESAGAYQLGNYINESHIWIIKPASKKSDEQISLDLIGMKEVQGNFLKIKNSLADADKPILKITSIDVRRTLYLSVTEGIQTTYIAHTRIQTDYPLLSMSYQVIPECNYNLKPLSSSDQPEFITSPGYPNNYPFAADCQWSFIRDNSTDGILHFAFQDIDIHPNHNLSIETSKKITHVTFDEDDLIIPNDKTKITWKTNYKGINEAPHRGFKMNVQKIDCGEVFTEKHNHFDTPKNIKPSVHCLWKIDVSDEPSPSNIQLMISNVTHRSSFRDNLTIYDGGNLTCPTINLVFNDGIAHALSRFPKVLIEYLSFDNGLEDAPYHIEYTYNKCEETCDNNMCMHPDWKCNGKNDCGDNSDELYCLFYDCGNSNFTTLLNEPINITLKDIYHKSYLNCIWTLEASEGKTITVKISELQLNDGQDVLLFGDGRNSSSPILGKFTNTSESFKEMILVTTGQYLWINLFSSQKDFIPNVNIEIIPQDVGGHFYGNHIITISNQSRNETSYFTFESEKDNQIRVSYNITKSPLPSYELCFYDQSLIPDNELICLGSNDEAFPVVSPSNEMIVTAKNFLNNLSAIINIENIPQGNDFFTSKMADSLKLFSVSNNTYTWRIKPKVKGIIVLTLNYLHLYEAETVSVIEGVSNLGKLIKKFDQPLKNTFVINIHSKNGVLFVYQCYHSINETSMPTVEVSYEVVPEYIGAIEAQSYKATVITSPNYPNQYPLNAFYEKNITLETSAVALYLTFNDLDLQPKHKLIISTSNSTILSISGKELPNDFVIPNQTINLRWTSSAKTNINSLGKGFSISFKGLECGDYYNAFHDEIQTPVNITAGNGTFCLWHVQIPPSMPLAYILFNIRSDKKILSQEELIIYDGGKLNSPTIPFHLIEGQAQFTSKTSNVLIQYKPIENGTQYHIKFTGNKCSETCDNKKYCLQPDWKCNGKNDCDDNSDELDCLFYDCGYAEFLTKAKNITLPQGLSDKIFLNCNWSLKASDGKTLLVKIHDFTFNYGKDVLIFREGQDSTILAKFTNSTEKVKDTIIVTSSNHLWINFFTDQKEFTPNFIIEVILQDLGGHFYGNQTITIENQAPNEMSYFIFQAKENEQVSVSSFSYELSSGSPELCFYDQYLSTDEELGCFVSSKPLVLVDSSSNVMIVTAKNFYDNSSVTINFDNILKGTKFFFSKLSGNINLTSVKAETYYIWQIIPNAEGIIILSLKHLNLFENEKITITQGITRYRVIKTFDHPLENTYTINEDCELGIIIEYQCNHTSLSSVIPTIDASFEVLPKSEFLKNLIVNPHQDIIVNTFNYPNQYPLNAYMEWTANSSSNLFYVNFEDVDLHPEHQLVIWTMNKGKRTNISTVYGSELPDDLVIEESQIHLTWSSQNTQNTSLGKGFKLRIRGIDCGGNRTALTSSFQMPGKASQECVWIVTGTQESMIEFKENSQNKIELLQIFDGGSIRSNPFEDVKVNSQLLSRFNKLLFYYNFVNSSNVERDASATISYSILFCNETSERCGNGICMHHDWRCNGRNNCGDNTDELNCESGGKSAVSTGAVIGISFACLFVGILLGFVVVPLIVKKYRVWRGNRFERLTETAT